MSKQLDILKQYFRSAGEAEEELDILDSVYVTQADIQNQIDSQNYHLIIGLKGVGKSALLHNQLMKGKKGGVGLFITPSDIAVEFPSVDEALGPAIRRIQHSLVSSIAVKMGERLNNKLAATTDYLLRREAILEGAATPDFVEKAAQVLSNFNIVEQNYDFKKLSDTLAPARTVNALFSSVKKHVGSNGTQITVCIDDTDFIASSRVEDSYRVWGLLVAAKNISNKISQARILIALKSNVWHRLISEGRYQDVDKLIPHLIDLSATDSHLTTIFQRRLEGASKACDEAGLSNPGDAPIDYFFTSKEVTLPETDNQKRHWMSLLSKNSRNRPRDLVQLVRGLIDASEKNHARIPPEIASQVILTHSGRCIKYVNAEFGHDIKPLDVLIEYLQDIDDEMDFETLRNFLENLPTRTSITIRGATLSPNNKDDLIRLLGVFYETGVLNARIVDKRKSEEYDHINFHDQPDLVSEKRWREMQGYRWEIHPAFRSHLHAARRLKQLRTGIAPKRPKK